MKRIISVLFLLLPAVTFAQSPQSKNGVDTMSMMQGMQNMQECMEKIDQSQMEEISKKSAQVGEEVNNLCRQGKKQAAQDRAMAWSKELRTYPVIKEVMKCQKYVKNNPAFANMLDPAKDFAKKNICDSE